MPAIRSGDADRFIAKPDPRAAVVLLHGPDQGLARERGAALVKAWGVDRADAFQFIALDGNEIASDPPRLADEVNTIPMFGGRRAVRVTLGSRSIENAVAAVLAAPNPDCPVLIEADDLKFNHPLRILVEKSPNGATVDCQEDDDARIAGLVRQELEAGGLSVDPDALALLKQSLGADRAASRLELRKLADYCAGAPVVTIADVETMVGDVALHALDALVDAAFDGALEIIEREAGPLLREATSVQSVIFGAMRHANLLRGLAVGHQQAGFESGRIAKRRRGRLADQQRRWTATKADRAIAVLAEAQIASRRHASNAAAITERALWSIALAARRSSDI